MAEITREDINKLDIKLDLLIKQVATLEALQATETERCPFREEVARASNSAERLEKLEIRVSKLELTWARIAGVIATAIALGGSAGAVVARLIP